MYNQFFRFELNPFSQTPPANNNYLPTSHFTILNQLDQAFKSSNGLFLLIGSIGVGKTSLIKLLVNNNDEIIIDLSPASTLQSSSSSQLEVMLNCISNSKSAPAIFFLDNADRYDDSLLSSLILTIKERNNSFPTLLLLTGQPSLESNIRTIQLKNANSLLLNCVSLPAFAESEIKSYIHYRLKLAGYSEENLFTDDAIQRIASLSKGLPRQINTICGVSIFQASLEQLNIINQNVVDKASEFCFLSNDSSQTKQSVELKEGIHGIQKPSKLHDLSTLQNNPDSILEKKESLTPAAYFTDSNKKNRALASSGSKTSALVSKNETAFTPFVKNKDLFIAPSVNKPKITTSKIPKNLNIERHTKNTSFFYSFRSYFYVVSIPMLLLLLLWNVGFQYLSSDSGPTLLKTSDLADNELPPTNVKSLLVNKTTQNQTAAPVRKQKKQLPQITKQKLDIKKNQQKWLAIDKSLPKSSRQKTKKMLKVTAITSKKVGPKKQQDSLPKLKKQKVAINTLAEKKQRLRKTKSSTNKRLPAPELAVKKRTSARYRLSQKGISYDVNSYFSSIEGGNIQLIKLFLDANMPIDIQEKPTGNTLLIKATKKGYLDIVITALNRKAKINRKNRTGKTALITAAANGRYSIALKLLKHGANVHLKDNKGWDALMVAVQRNQLAIVKDLLKYGANKNTQNSAGMNALLIAKKNNHYKILSLLD